MTTKKSNAVRGRKCPRCDGPLNPSTRLRLGAVDTRICKPCVADLLTLSGTSRARARELARGARVFEAVVHAFEGDDNLVPDDLRDHGMVRRATRYRAAQVQEMERLESEIARLRGRGRVDISGQSIESGD